MFVVGRDGVVGMDVVVGVAAYSLMVSIMVLFGGYALLVGGRVMVSVGGLVLGLYSISPRVGSGLGMKATSAANCLATLIRADLSSDQPTIWA